MSTSFALGARAMVTVSVRGPSAVSMAKITPTCVNCTRAPAWQTGWLPSNFKDLAVSRSRQCCPTGQTIFIDFRLSRLLWRSTAHLTEENIIRLNTNRSVRFGGMPVAFRLQIGLGKKTSLPMRRYVSVGFPACMRIRRKELQFAMSPATRSMPVSTTLAHSLQGPLWIGYVWVNLSKLSRFSPLQRPMISPRGYM